MEEKIKEIRINKEWTIILKIIDGKYLKIESDCDLIIYPDAANIITLKGRDVTR